MTDPGAGYPYTLRASPAQATHRIVAPTLPGAFGRFMTAKTFRAAALALTLCVVAQAAGEVPSRAAEQDTANGVAPVKAEHAAEASEKPAAEHTPAPEHPETGEHTAEAAAAPPSLPAKPQPVPPPAAVAAPVASEAQRYCDNIAAIAAEARFAWQTRKLNELQGQVSSRIAELEKKQAELESSLARRDDAMRKAQATLISVYSKMDPEAAAAQLALLDDGLAAAVLVQLTPKQSSLILNEIKPERASQLVAAMTNLPAPDTKQDGKKS